jgi:hypothetical protein
VHVEHDDVRVGQMGRALEHQCDRPALPASGAAEQGRVPLEKAIAVRDRDRPALGDEAAQRQPLLCRHVLAEDRHEPTEELSLDEMAGTVNRRERAGAALEDVAPWRGVHRADQHRSHNPRLARCVRPIRARFAASAARDALDHGDQSLAFVAS